MIGGVSGEVDDSSGITLTIDAEGITATTDVDTVWAVILPVDYCSGQPSDQAEVELAYSMAESNAYGTYDVPSGISDNCLAYRVTVYAKDSDNNTSMPCETMVYQEEEAICSIVKSDDYEPDDDEADAGIIVINDNEPRTHNFCEAYDEDWVMFYGVEGQYYTVTACNLGANSRPVIELYDENLQIQRTRVPENDNMVYLDWYCTQSGIYYVRLWNHLLYESMETDYDNSTEYDLTVDIPEVPFLGFIIGTVNSTTGGIIAGARIWTSVGYSSISYSDGMYDMMHQEGTYTLFAEADGYNKYTGSVSVSQGGTETKNISMVKSSSNGDNNGSSSSSGGGGGGGSAAETSTTTTTAQPETSTTTTVS